PQQQHLILLMFSKLKSCVDLKVCYSEKTLQLELSTSRVENQRLRRREFLSSLLEILASSNQKRQFLEVCIKTKWLRDYPFLVRIETVQFTTRGLIDIRTQ